MFSTKFPLSGVLRTARMVTSTGPEAELAPIEQAKKRVSQKLRPIPTLINHFRLRLPAVKNMCKVVAVLVLDPEALSSIW